MSTRDNETVPKPEGPGPSASEIYRRLAERHLAEPLEQRMELENGNYAILADGFVHLHLGDGSELFSVDSNTVHFEKKFLLAMMQIFLIGVQRGRATELASVRQKLAQIMNLVFN